MDYFDWFGLKRSFVINQKDLRSAFMQKSMSLHPDKTADKSTSEADSAYNNLAYTTLKNQQTRLEYILQLEGVISTDAKHELPQEFLMEMLNLNMEIEDAKAAGDQAKLEAIQNLISEMDAKAFKTIESILTDYSNHPFNDSEKEVLKKYHLIKRYLLRIGESITTFATH